MLEYRVRTYEFVNGRWERVAVRRGTIGQGLYFPDLLVRQERERQESDARYPQASRNGAPDVPLSLRGATYLDTGFVYTPYVPTDVTPRFVAPEMNRHRMLSRYAGKIK